MKNKNPWIFLVTGLLAGALMMYLLTNYRIEKKSPSPATEITASTIPAENHQSTSGRNIDQLTEETTVIAYVQKNHRLPDCYITKADARKLGWNASAGNLCDVLPGRAIGGDHFGNREKKLPTGAQYYEADVNYRCGNRNADRIVFTKTGEVWLSKDHYRTFEKQ